jgi:demethylmenaquinone methyltransferase/2-methoxy-6-polyprenyl-1,4-benzoquinol methylase
MSSLRRLYYDLFSKVYDFIIRVHSRDKEGALRKFISEKATLFEGARALDLCTGTGSVAVELARQVGETGFVAGLDFSHGMLERQRKRRREQRCLKSIGYRPMPVNFLFKNRPFTV